MSYISVDNPPKYNGSIFPSLSDIPSPSEGDRYKSTFDGSLIVYRSGAWSFSFSNTTSNTTWPNGSFGSTGSYSSEKPSYLPSVEFMLLLQELVLFDGITKDRYFQLKKLYNSEGLESLQMASKMVNELHAKMMKG